MNNVKFSKEYCRNISVLIVDDNFDVREFTEAILDSLNFKVKCASDGREGLEFYLQSSYDIVFTDIKMPYLDGITMIKKIKSINKDQHFIVTSAYGDVENLTELLNLQVSGFLPKPSTLQHIQDVFLRVSKLLFFEKELEKYQGDLERMVEEKTTQLKVNNNRLLELENIIISNKTYALMTMMEPEEKVLYQTSNKFWFTFKFEDFFSNNQVNTHIIDPLYRDSYLVDFEKFCFGETKSFQKTFKLINVETYVKVVINKSTDNKGSRILHYIFYDVSRDKIKEEQLDLFFQIIDQVKMGVIITNNEANIHYSNKVFLDFCEKRLEEVIGKNFPVNAEKHPELKEILPDLYNGNKKIIKIKKGDRSYKVTVFPVKNSVGHPTENRVILIDKV
jgi:YesN/AraC family two-component response regulator